MTGPSSGVPGPPPDGGYVEMAGGILWIRLPIPGGLRHINLWLLPARRGWHLVDTGMDTPGIRQAWQRLEQRLPLQRELADIVVTHHHPDHFGMARWLADRFDVPVHMSAQAGAAADAGLARETDAAPRRSEDFAARLGLELDPEMRRILRGGIYRSIVSGPVDTLGLEAGSLLHGQPDWTVSIHDGHAPGHACLLQEGGGMLVSGDQVLPSISSNVSLYPSNEDEDPLGQYLRSLQALCELPEDTLVLPSHGRPFFGLHARARAVHDGHATRLRAIHDSLARPTPTMQVADQLFRLARLDALNRLLALTETLAHLRWLEVRGLVTRSGEGSTLHWEACGPSAPFAVQ